MGFSFFFFFPCWFLSVLLEPRDQPGPVAELPASSLFLRPSGCPNRGGGPKGMGSPEGPRASGCQIRVRTTRPPGDAAVPRGCCCPRGMLSVPEGRCCPQDSHPSITSRKAAPASPVPAPNAARRSVGHGESPGRWPSPAGLLPLSHRHQQTARRSPCEPGAAGGGAEISTLFAPTCAGSSPGGARRLLPLTAPPTAFSLIA